MINFDFSQSNVNSGWQNITKISAIKEKRREENNTCMEGALSAAKMNVMILESLTRELSENKLTVAKVEKYKVTIQALGLQMKSFGDASHVISNTRSQEIEIIHNTELSTLINQCQPPIQPLDTGPFLRARKAKQDLEIEIDVQENVHKIECEFLEIEEESIRKKVKLDKSKQKLKDQSDRADF